jgi:ribonucleoside-triphosphate reductase
MTFVWQKKLLLIKCFCFRISTIKGNSMLEKVLKRNGCNESFEAYKIEDAIKKAFKSEHVNYDSEVFFNVIEIVKNKRVIAVEDIQDIIEKELYKSRYFEVMKSFMLYRNIHKMQREHILGLNDDTTYINSTQTIHEYINGSDWRIKANSNTGYSHAGLINNSAGKIIANYWLDKIYSKEEGYAHRNGDYHIHDLDCLSGYCAGWSLRVLLDEGFNGVRGRVESRAPNHFREALGQMANFLGILQSEWAGAQAFSSFDTYLSPYVFKDQLDYNEIKKAIKSFIYNLNVPARWGQSPFTNVTIDWTVPDDLKEQIPTRNNQHLFKNIQDEKLLELAKERGCLSLEELTYKHFQKEMHLINKAYYEVMTQGDKTGQPFTFPIPTVNITEDFDWYGENTDILFENTAKIGSSYFQNFIGSQYTKDENGNLILNEEAYKPGHVRSMCCRLQLDLRELLKRGGGLFGSAEMTGSIGVVTINMARLGYLYKNDKKALYQRLEELMDLAKSTLEKKRVFVQDMYERGLYPYTKRYLHGFNNHFSTIGVNGINEMLRNFTQDKHTLTSDYGKEFSIELLDFMRAKMIAYQEETGNLYNLEATPAEGTTYRFAKEDKKRYKDILQAGMGKNIYYTNSSQIPVDYTDDPFEALSLQDDLQCKYTGGTVLHLYMKEKISSIEACRKLVQKVISNYKLPYITITPLFSVCDIHGYIVGEHEFCPKCDENLLKELKSKEN